MNSSEQTITFNPQAICHNDVLKSGVCMCVCVLVMYFRFGNGAMCVFAVLVMSETSFNTQIS